MRCSSNCIFVGRRPWRCACLSSLGMQALWDAVLCVANLLLCAAVPQLFSTFTTVAFLELIVFCVIEMRYLLLVWQAHDPQRNWDAAGWVQLRRELATVHAHFYVALAVVLLVLYASRDEPSLILLAASSYWVPQIIRNVKTNAREPVCDHYLYGMSVSRLLLPAYLLLVQDALPRVLMVPSTVSNHTFPTTEGLPLVSCLASNTSCFIKTATVEGR